MMNISRLTRLKYYGEKWRKWVRKNTHTGNKSDIPERHQQKRVIRQDRHGIGKLQVRD